MAGSHEAVFQVSLKDYHTDMDDFKDDFRARLKKVLPDTKVSFEPIELTDKVLSRFSYSN
jgi:hypothetical protein